MFLTSLLLLSLVSISVQSMLLIPNQAKAEFEAPSMAIPGQCYMNVGAVICISHPAPNIIPYIMPNPLIKPTVNGTIIIPIPLNIISGLTDPSTPFSNFTGTHPFIHKH